MECTSASLIRFPGTASARGGHQRRSSPRVAVKAPVRLIIPDREPLVAHALDISWGGASFLSTESLGAIGDSIVVEAPWSSGQALRVAAQIVWIETVSEQSVATGAQFTSLSITDQERLESLLSMLISPSAQARSSICLAERIETDYQDPEDFQETLAEVATGRLRMVSHRAYDKNASVQLGLAFNGRSSTWFRARVVECWVAEQASTAPASAHGPFLLDLGFEHPVEDLARVAQRLEQEASRETLSHMPSFT
jgi:Tfp pilus assembly protein PilZ